MQYPDGQKVNVGDIIWWNEGNEIGKVHALIESSAHQTEWSESGPGIVVMALPRRKDIDPAQLFWAERDFNDEGIGLYDGDSKYGERG